MNCVTVDINKNKSAPTSLSIFNDIYIIFNCTVGSFLVCCCAIKAVKISQREQRRGSTVCVRAQEGSVKSLRQSSIRLTRLPPETTAMKPVVGCQSPVAVFLHEVQASDRSDYRPQSAYERPGDRLV